MDDPAAMPEGNASALGREASVPVGIVVRRSPGVTRWARTVWRAVALLPGAPPADFRLMREDGDAAEYHAATVPLHLHRADVEGYRVTLAMATPAAFVVLRAEPGRTPPWRVHAITASAYEAQDHLDSGEDVVEPVAMPPALLALVSDFVEAHRRDVPFVKRQRDQARSERAASGIGDPRVRQLADVYRVPGARRDDG